MKSFVLTLVLILQSTLSFAGAINLEDGESIRIRANTEAFISCSASRGGSHGTSCEIPSLKMNCADGRVIDVRGCKISCANKDAFCQDAELFPSRCLLNPAKCECQ